MTSWPLYAFYMALLALPLLFFIATKPGYEKSADRPARPLRPVRRSSAKDDPSKPAFKHSAKHNAQRSALASSTPPGSARSSTQTATPG